MFASACQLFGPVVVLHTCCHATSIQISLPGQEMLLCSSVIVLPAALGPAAYLSQQCTQMPIKALSKGCTHVDHTYYTDVVSDVVR